ncbi:uncharacterized protein LOC121858704 [Homarus americanus]|uniref:uncharacterized protein LOC121858704 n=1 Tax=Homarus americanus TaxID=6706 RepID=UPI001C471806|nr:uncharacterized protein LOC121858704 [Homarus americanus]XP_042211228.1 uncharacterized protein LOC121858704 [Homarus americanus]
MVRRPYTCHTPYNDNNRTWTTTRHVPHSTKHAPYSCFRSRTDHSSTNAYITSPEFLSRVHNVALLMASQSSRVHDLPFARYFVPGSSLPQDLEEGRNPCLTPAPQLREAITPSLRQYCRSFMATMVCPQRVASQVMARMVSMETTAYHDHPHSKMKYCWQLSAALCLILEDLGRIRRAR